VDLFSAQHRHRNWFFDGRDFQHGQRSNVGAKMKIKLIIGIVCMSLMVAAAQAETADPDIGPKQRRDAQILLKDLRDRLKQENVLIQHTTAQIMLLTCFLDPKRRPPLHTSFDETVSICAANRPRD
jgi:hypothetical protein